MDRRGRVRARCPTPPTDRPLVAARGARLRRAPVIVGPADRPRLRRLSRALIGYGVVGLAVAALGLIALLVGLGRVNGLTDRLRADVGGVSEVLEQTGDVLERAATTATGFGVTIDGSTTALTTAA